jgi:hypothetical protein
LLIGGTLRPQSLHELKAWLVRRAAKCRAKVEKAAQVAVRYDTLLAQLDDTNVVVPQPLKMIK